VTQDHVVLLLYRRIQGLQEAAMLHIPFNFSDEATFSRTHCIRVDVGASRLLVGIVRNTRSQKGIAMANDPRKLGPTLAFPKTTIQGRFPGLIPLRITAKPPMSNLQS
jgi:hypothetical protein